MMDSNVKFKAIKLLEGHRGENHAILGYGDIS